MSFSIILQSNNSPKNKIGKSLTTLSTLEGTLRQESDIINPTILIESSSVITANYMTISEFKRSYFITDIRSIRNNLWEISGHVDVLESFSSEIRSNTVIVGTQQNDWNLYLDDDTFKAQVNPLIIVKAFPTDSEHAFNTIQYVLATAGNH